MVERNEICASLFKKPEIDPSTENNPTPQPQTEQKYPKIIPLNISVRTDSARAINNDRIQATGEVNIRLNLFKRSAYQTTMWFNISRRRYDTPRINRVAFELQVDTGSGITIISDED
ncbi:hypothetical protein ACTXT7_005724 [Hymenolepis weldensis]